MKHLCLFLIALALCAAGCGPDKHLDDKLTWQKFDIVAANFPRAPQPGSKPILVYFAQENCHFCTHMDSLFARPEVAWFVNEHFLPVKVDVDADLPLRTGNGEEITYQRLFQIFKMDGFPVYYMFDTTGQIMGMMQSATDLLTLKRTLKYIGDHHFGRKLYAEFLKMDDVPSDTTFGVF